MTFEKNQNVERDKPNEAQPARPHVDMTDRHDWSRFTNNQQERMRTDTASCVRQGTLPDTHIDFSGGSARGAEAGAATGRPESTLSDANATDQQKLHAAEQLVASGQNHVTVTDKDGTKRELRLETEHLGHKTMVHMFAEENGKEHVVLRGLDNGDGTFSHEKDGHGHDVSFGGTWWSHNMAGKSSLTGSGDNLRGGAPPQRNDGGYPPDDRQRGRQDVPPYQPLDGNNTGAPEAGSIDRSQFDSQLQDPRVMAAFAGRMSTEVGSQGHDAQVAFAEEVMNRAASRNQTLMQALSGRYYPTSHPGSSNNPNYIASINEAWHQGTDTTNGATGNASGRVGFGVSGGHYDSSHHWVSPNQTANVGGERFGYEQVDLSRGWLNKYESLKRREV